MCYGAEQNGSPIWDSCRSSLVVAAASASSTPAAPPVHTIRCGAPDPKVFSSSVSDEADASPSEEFLKAVARAPAVPPPAAEPDLVGQHLGRYRVLSRLGQGGMGIVYRAKDSVLGREVALKVLPQNVTRDPSRRRRFLKEARLAAAIAHPNLVATYDVGDTEERIYLAMELVDGEPLRSRLASGPMDIEEVLRVGADLSRGVARAHAAGIVHRDLKPENVMIARDGTVKILDFGIATIRATSVDGTTPTESGIGESDLGVVVGTPAYMSPEQAKLRDVTDKSDCFALGVVLYEMITGQRPFSGSSAFEIVIAIDRDSPPRPDAARSGVPRALADLVMTCLEKDPRARPPAESIARALTGIALGAPPATFGESRRGRSPLRYAGATALVVSGVVAVLALRREPRAMTETAAPAFVTTEADAPASVTSPFPSPPPPSERQMATASGPAVASAPVTSSTATSARAAKAKVSVSAVPTASSRAEPAIPSAPPATSKARDPLADPI